MSSIADLRDAGIPAEAVRAYLEELGLPRHDVHLDPARIRRLAVEALAAMPDDDLAERTGAPVSLVPALRGARDLNEARQYARLILSPEPAHVPDAARPTLERFRELVNGDGHAVVRELKAVGGDLKALRLALTGRERGPELATSSTRSRATRPSGGSMRLYSTLQRAKVDLPEPPGPIRMYFCGPTVYARAHIGNARPFVLSACGSAPGSGERGYDVTLVHNITDVNDKIYDAAPGAERRARRARDGVVPRGHRRPRPRRCRTSCRRRPSTSPAIVRFIEELVERGFAYPAGGDVYFRISRFPGYGALSGRPDTEGARNPSEEEEQTELKEDPRDFALWKAHKEGEDTSWDSPWGRGRPGWHIECSAMAEELLGPALRDPRRRARPRLPAPRERARAVARARARLRADLDAQRDAPLHRREDVEIARQRRHDPRGARPLGPRDAAAFFMTAHWSKPIDFSEETMAQAAAQVETFRNKLRYPGEPGDDWQERVAPRSTTTSTRRTRSPCPPLARPRPDRPRARRVRARLAGRRGPGAGGGRGAARSSAGRRGPARDFGESDRLRDEIEAQGWEVRDAAGRLPARPQAVTDRPRLRPPRRSRGCCAGGGRCSRCYATRAGARGRSLASRRTWPSAAGRGRSGR